MMNGRSPEMLEVSPINAFAERFTRELDEFVRERLPVTMDDVEYGRATAAMLISLNRTMASTGVAFAMTHGVQRQFLETTQIATFRDNLTLAYDAVQKGSGTVQ
jgi:hypothetical protein